MEIITKNEQDTWVDTLGLENAARHSALCAIGEKASGCEVSIVLVDEAAIRRLNSKHRQVDRPTDVLAFPLVEPFMVQPGDLLGDVVLCPAVAVERAVSEGRSGEREILELVVHGVLHLIGYDHATDEERGIMFDLQERVLSELGV